MAILSKEAYEGKERAAGRRMAENAEIEALTPEQHDALSWLCTIRHEMHTNQEAFFHEESGRHSKFWGYIEDGINEKLKAAELPAIDFKMKIEDYNTDGLVLGDMTREEREDDDLVNEKMQEALAAVVHTASTYNSIIESYLREIDEKNGTNYCPCGKSRLL